MTADALLAYLREQGAELWTDGERLRCNAPKGVLTPALQADLAAHKAEIIQLLRPAGADPIRPLPRDGPLPLSFAQQRLWFLHQFEPSSPFYNTHVAARLAGRLDTLALERTLSEIVRRHEALRTTFPELDGQPVQAIAPAAPVALAIEDLAGLPPGLREAEALRMAAEEAARPFDLARGPLVRVQLLRLAEEQHILLWTMHHITSDAWSISVLIREVVALYSAFASGRPSPLPELPVQYADFAAWQRAQLQGGALERQLAYWKAALDGAAPVLSLPTDAPRPAAPSFQGERQQIALSKALSEQLGALGRAEGATLFMVLLAAFQALLARYSGQDDIVVGTPIAGRNRIELEGLIGYFANTLVVRADLSGNPSFRELLGRVRERVLAAYAHQDLPFEKLVEELQPPRHASYSPIFQVLFALQNIPVPTLQLPELTLSLFESENRTSKFDLTVYLSDTEQGLRGTFGYNTDLFEAPTIARMIGHFQTLLESVVRGPAARLSALPLLSEAERHQLLVEWNAPAFSLQPSAFSLQELFAAQAARAPDAIAIQMTTDDRPPTTEADSAFSLQPSAFSLQMTYAELDRRANQLARYLRGRGVGPEVRVGICVERSLELVMAVLAVLKAGGAYVPLDPSYPAERIAFMLEDSGAQVLITTTDDRRPTTDEDAERSVVGGPWSVVETVDLLADWPAIARQPATGPDVALAADNLAYVIYTSGSTGRPKGVAVAHANIVRLFASTRAWFRFDQRDVWTLFHSAAFDFSVWELWGALLHGGRLVVVPYWVARSPEAFARLLAAQRVTVLNQTPAAFYQLARAEEELNAARGLALRLVIFGGEALDVARLAPWPARHGEQLVNMYGITETTVHVTCRPIGAADLARPDRSPIGRPIPDLRVYVLDRHMQPAPIGLAGELYVGGAGLARGYLNRPELTAERFVPNPFLKDEGGRMKDESGAFSPHPSSFRLYRTGDLARWLPDGEIEYLGRLDQQVKLRGFRIELGEIEAALGAHPAVRAAVVLAREDTPGDKRLVAYVVTSEKLSVTSSEASPPVADNSSLVTHNSSLAAELRSFLAQRLPAYMIPSAFVILEALPLTSNGKLDRAALPAPDRARPALESALIEPGNPIEIKLAALWRELLGIERIGIHDNFFELGGHSLLLTQLASRIRAAFRIELPLRLLFDAPTIAEMARAILARQLEQVKQADVARMLDRIKQLAPDEVKALLAQQGRSG